MENNYNINITTFKNKIQVTIEGDLTLVNAKKIQEQIIDMANNKLELEIIIQNTHDIDISFLQIIISLVKNYEENCKIKMSLPDEIVDILKISGLLDIPNLNISYTKQ